MIPIQYIIKATDVAVAAEQTQTALEAGLRWIHLSMPEASDAEVLPVAKVLRKMCSEHNATFIIEDHLEVVKAVKADGAFLSAADLPVGKARMELGEEFLLATTVHDMEDVRRWRRESADYLWLIPDPEADALIVYADTLRQMYEEDIPTPVCAVVSSFSAAAAQEILATGVRGLALNGPLAGLDLGV